MCLQRALLALSSSYLQLEFRDGCIWVSEQWRHREDLADVLMALPMRLWTWNKFTYSRWAPLGSSCRVLSPDVLVGIIPLVADTLAQPGAITYFLQGCFEVQP